MKWHFLLVFVTVCFISVPAEGEAECSDQLYKFKIFDKIYSGGSYSSGIPS